nr:substrate-binding domain-containing protein [Luteolibacter marinus]
MTLEFEQPSGGDLPPVRISRGWKGDGLLVFRPRADELAAWKKLGIPGVNLSTEQIPGTAGFPRVTLDNRRAGEMAADHLLAMGLRNFAYLHDSNRFYAAERLAGFRDRLAAAGFGVEVIDIPASTFKPSQRANQFHRMACHRLSALKPPCGLFAKDDIAAVVAIRALRQAGRRVPEDVPVLGVADDIVYCLATTPPLSSIRFPGRAVGHEAARLLDRQMGGERIDARERIQIPPRGIVRRESTGRVEYPDPVVTRAIATIGERIKTGTVAAGDLARLAGVPRESLRLRFQETLGRSPKQEIDRLRAEHIGEQLRRGVEPLEQIAEACGFGGSDDLCRFFKRVKGCTAGEWRRR